MRQRRTDCHDSWLVHSLHERMFQKEKSQKKVLDMNSVFIDLINSSAKFARAFSLWTVKQKVYQIFDIKML